MSARRGNGAEWKRLVERKAPEYLDLLTASTLEEFEDAFCPLLERAVMHLEQNKKHYADLGEEALTSVLVARLSIPGLTVTQETHSNGHVDLTIEADHSTPVRRKLGEAKIYNGAKYHEGGLEQLLTRYTTGRETRGLLIVYCKTQGIKEKVQSLRTHMDASQPQDQQGSTSDHKLPWSFRSAHAHSSGELVEVDHVGCNLC